MGNELVGIVGVFAFTLILFLLRHFCMSFGRPDKSRQARTTSVRENQENLVWRPVTMPGFYGTVRTNDRTRGSPFGTYGTHHEDVKGHSKRGSPE
jgi:hypothetical protein